MPQADKRFIPELEATRGLAALIVALFHVSLTGVVATDPAWLGSLWQLMRTEGSTVEWLVTGIAQPFFNGHAAVLYFFVLSGFVLAASLERDQGRPLPLSWRFLIRRLFRIYPAVITTILLFVLLYRTMGLYISWPQAYALLPVLRNMLLLEVSIDGVMWTMQTELLAIPVILLGFLLWKKAHLLWLVGFGGLLTALSYSLDWRDLLGDPSRTAPLYAFVYGMFAFAIGRRAIRWVPPRLHGLGAILSALVLLASPQVIGQKHLVLVQVSAASFLVCYVAFGPSPAVARALNRAPIRFLGRVSYSFYLLHPLTLTVIWNRPQLWQPILEAGVPRLVLLVALAIATVAAVLPLAWLSYRFVEQPGVELGRRLSGRSRKAAAPASEAAAGLAQRGPAS